MDEREIAKIRADASLSHLRTLIRIECLETLVELRKLGPLVLDETGKGVVRTMLNFLEGDEVLLLSKEKELVSWAKGLL